MCVVSMVMEHYINRWQPLVQPVPVPYPFPVPAPRMPTHEEVSEFHRLLERARKYDAEHNEPDCELEEKRQLLLKLAKELGVELQLAPGADAGLSSETIGGEGGEL